MATSDEFPPTGYQDDRSGDHVQHSVIDEQVTVKKKGSKLPLIIFSVFILVALLVVGYMMFKPAPTPPAKPRPAPVEQTEPAKDPAAPTEGADLLGTDPNAPVADPNAPAAQPAIDPATGLPLTQPAIDPATGLPVTQAAQPAIDPATGLPVTPAANPAQPAIDPATGLPVAAAANPAQPAQPAIDPATGLPVAPAAANPAQPAAVAVQPAPVVVQPAPAQPAPAQPTVDPLAAQPVAQPAPVAVQPEPVAEIQDANDPLAQFRTLLAPIDSRVTALEKKVGKLVRDVTNIQSWMKGSAAPAPKARAQARPARSNNTVRVQSRDPYDGRPVSPPVSRVIIEDGTVRAANNEAVVAPVRPAYDAMSSCNVQAIVQGRVWIKRADGSFVSYGEGDAWTNGRTIHQIDPARGVLVDGQWMCM